MTPAGTDINTVCKAFLTEARVKALRALLRSDRSEAVPWAGDQEDDDKDDNNNDEDDDDDDDGQDTWDFEADE